MASEVGELRISGLVRLMNGVRDKLRGGIPTEEQAVFRADVRRAVERVERLCAENQTTPDRLPAPSRRAYEYLRDLDFSRLPEPQGRQAPDEEEFRLAGLVSTCNDYHRQFAKAVAVSKSNFSAKSPEVRTLSARLRTDADAVVALCEDGDTSPAALPIRSRRAYQWLRFLSDPKNLLQHLRALRYVTQEAQRRLPSERSPGGVARAPQVQIALTSMLYQVKASTTSRRITIDEGFIAAPSGILDTLVRLSLSRKADEADQQRIRAYAGSEAFSRIHEDLRAIIGPAPSTSESAKGLHHDLNAVFDRVNAAYFHGEMPRPRLSWGRTRTHRKLAHYDEPADHVMVSLTLDDSKVPGYALDFVMYHELLHKSLGTRVVKGRRHAHTRAFREAERAFRQYDRARRVIDKVLEDID